ncbi:hypothetical protein ACWGF2_17405 [Streptomyces sp. NPDC054919]
MSTRLDCCCGLSHTPGRTITKTPLPGFDTRAAASGLVRPGR